MNDSPQPVVRINHLSQAYKDVRALDDITLGFPSGQMIGLLGPDGVGKSTLLDLISGARVMQQGDLEVLGGDMRSARHRWQIGPRIAYMPQGLGKNLYSELSVRENLDFFGKLFGQKTAERRERIERLTKVTGLFAFLNRPVGKLSGGMKQKLGLCCALLHDPDLLILDEPTTGVDPLSRRQFWELIAAIRAESNGMSVLVSTAYMDEAEEFDWLVAMDAGQILDTGTAEELKQKTGTKDLEAAFIHMLPEEKRRGRQELIIPPLEQNDDKPAIVARGLTKRFGDFTAVHNVSFEIQPGEIFGFLGSNGCGKTTTMKMLTGLLPMSEGEAFLFGKAVDASDMDMRKRVGFMSQAFSLYGELTIAQNMALHAHLFQMDPEVAEKRKRDLAERFGLTKHWNAKSGSLPLGIRQRLSLAVAVLHEPEILILDEPTSGVDPIARDEFWELLVELSRRDKVTIFISTHFMNEALRCDRVSLMHAGEVLIYGKPNDLAQTIGVETLEEAFVHYIEQAMEPSQVPDEAIGIEASASVSGNRRLISDGHEPSLKRFSLTRLFAYTYRESIEILRDPIRLTFAFLGSMVLLILVSYGVSMDVENVKFAVLDHDQTPASRSYANSFSGSRSFQEEPELMSIDDLQRRLVANEITVAFEIPSGFGRELAQGNNPEVSAWIDGANTMRAGTIEAYVVGAHTVKIYELLRVAGYDIEKLSTFSIENRYRYNPGFESLHTIGPAVPAMLLILFPAVLMAVSVAREKESGTITNFYVMPTSKLEFLVGKQLPYVAIAMFNYVVLILLVIFVLGVPLKGSLLVLTIGAFLYALAVTAYGLLISSITKTQVSAVFAAAILSLMPTVQFSGLIQPVSTLSEGGQLIGTLWPASYFMHLSVGAFTKALGFQELSTDLLALSAFMPVFLIAATLLLNKQEK